MIKERINRNASRGAELHHPVRGVVYADTKRLVTVAANWFFSGHDNKLTADVSRLTIGQPDVDTLDDTRSRFQWDVNF